MILNGREVVIDDVEFEFYGNTDGIDLIILVWSGNIGFGEYSLYKEKDGQWRGDSECMDRGEDKEFIRLLLDKFVEGLEIES